MKVKIVFAMGALWKWYTRTVSHIFPEEVVLPSGEIAFYENIANPIIDANGKSTLEIARNITGRKEAEEEMHLLQTIIVEISASKIYMKR